MMLNETSAKIIGFVVFNFWSKIIILAVATVILVISLSAEKMRQDQAAWEQSVAPKIESGAIAVFDYDKCTIYNREKIYCPTE